MSRILFSFVVLMAGLLASSSAYLPVVLQTTTVQAQDDFISWSTEASGDEVVALAVDPDDENLLWSATEGGGLVIWDLVDETFTQYLFPQQEGLRSNHVYDLVFDRQGYGWLATAEGVTRALPGDTNWQHWGIDEGLPDVLVNAIAVDAAGSVWAGTEGGLAVLEAGGSEFIPVPAVDFEPDADTLLEGPGSDKVVALATDAAGWVYVAHGRGGGGDAPAISVLQESLGGWQHIPPVGVGSSDPGPPTDQILSLSMADDGRLWMGTWARGVVSWDVNADEWTVFDESDGLCSKYVWAVAALEDGVWAACGSTNVGEGVARYNGAEWTSWNVDDGLARDEIVAMASAGGRVFLATNGMGTNRTGGVGGSGIIPFDDTPGEPLSTEGKSPGANDITAMAFENDGTLWAGTLDQGLLRRDPGSRTWTRYTFENTDQRLAGDTVTDLALRVSPTGVRELWVAAAPSVLVNSRYIDGGVSVLNLDTGVWEFQFRDGSSGIADGDVSSLAVDESGIVWMGFGNMTGAPGSDANEGNGVAGYDLENDTWFPFEYTGGDDGPAGNTVGALAAESGELWAASAYQNGYGVDEQRVGGGISVLVGNRWSNWTGGDRGFRTFHGSGIESDRDAFITGDVRSVAIDRDGLAWAGTYDIEVGSLVGKWPYVDAVVNGQVNDNEWESWAFEGSGWVSALQVDTEGFIWAGTTRGHYPNSEPFREYSPKDDRGRDTAVGGAYVWDGSAWTELTPLTSGIASNAITSFAVDPTTGYVWVGTENSGLSVYQQGTPWQSTPTPGASATPDPDSTARPTQNAATATVRSSSTPAPVVASSTPAVVVTVAVPGDGDGDDDDDGDGDGGSGEDDEPEPPSEVPEAGTWFLMLLGLLGGWVFMEWQQRRRAQVI